MTPAEVKYLLEHPDIAQEYAKNGHRNLEVMDTRYPNPEWRPSHGPRFDSIELVYRIRPQPKLRPWTPDEVPDCWIRRKDAPNCCSRVVAIYDGPPAEVHFLHGRPLMLSQAVSLETLAESYEFRSSNGKWLPCGNYDVR